MSRTITLTPTEAADLAQLHPGDKLWLVRQGWRAYHDHQPPDEFVQACAPCGTCGGQRIAMSGGPAYFSGGKLRHCAGGQTVMEIHCPDCRVELVGQCPSCDGGGMVANCGRTDNGSDGPCVLAPHADNFPCYGDGDVADDWSPVSWCKCGRCSCGSLQAWTEQGPCGYCHEQPRPGTVTLGFAYAVGEPRQTDDGKWAVELRRVS